ncbi:MAG: sensor histidine kinase, partial [Ktedonobacterales bacterium]
AAPARLIKRAPRHVGTLPVFADDDRISQVVANFLSNALKYSSPHTPIVVSLAARDGHVRVSVRDRGPGLPPDEVPRVWERFHQVPGIAMEHGSGIGLGLGLFICKTIIERHGGEVGVTSAPGRGSTFWFTLSLVADEEAVPH